MTTFPLKKEKIYISSDSQSFEKRNFEKETEILIGEHVGAFGTERKNHVHEGIDLYCELGDEVFAMESGTVTLIEDFTGPKANSPWWEDTRAVHIEGESGVIIYGEIIEKEDLKLGDFVKEGEFIGKIKTVLKKDKGRPMNMLHLELHEHGTRASYEWKNDEEKPKSLKDPTSLLIKAAKIEKIPH